MIDYIKINLTQGYDEILLSNELLDFYSSVNVGTAEVRTVNDRGREIVPYQQAYYKGLRFKVYETGRVLIDGSLHKYFNNGDHNHNDFDIVDLKRVIIEIISLFQISPKDAEITQLELGVNLQFRYSTSQILQNLFFHRKVAFMQCETKTEGNYYQVKHGQYRLKFYDKSLQYRGIGMEIPETLRLEVNMSGVKLRRDFKIRNLHDLLRKPFSELITFFADEIELILFYDFTIDSSSKRLLNYSNRNYWQGLIDGGRTSAYDKHRSQLKGLISSSSEEVLGQLAEEVEGKSLFLTKGGKSIEDICIGLIDIPYVVSVVF